MAKALLEDPANRKLVSVASCWEIAIKAGLGKLKLGEPSASYIPNALANTGFELLPHCRGSCDRRRISSTPSPRSIRPPPRRPGHRRPTSDRHWRPDVGRVWHHSALVIAEVLPRRRRHPWGGDLYVFASAFGMADAKVTAIATRPQLWHNVVLKGRQI